MREACACSWQILAAARGPLTHRALPRCPGWGWRERLSAPLTREAFETTATAIAKIPEMRNCRPDLKQS